MQARQALQNLGMAGTGGTAGRVRAATQRLRRDVAALRFSAPVTHVYNPLEYALKPHYAYVRAFADTTKRVLFLGMNPGPFGMAQTGVPFGEVAHVRGWLGIEARVAPSPTRPSASIAPVPGSGITERQSAWISPWYITPPPASWWIR